MLRHDGKFSDCATYMRSYNEIAKITQTLSTHHSSVEYPREELFSALCPTNDDSPNESKKNECVPMPAKIRCPSAFGQGN